MVLFAFSVAEEDDDKEGQIAMSAPLKRVNIVWMCVQTEDAIAEERAWVLRGKKGLRGRRRERRMLAVRRWTSHGRRSVRPRKRRNARWSGRGGFGGRLRGGIADLDVGVDVVVMREGVSLSILFSYVVVSYCGLDGLEGVGYIELLLVLCRFRLKPCHRGIAPARRFDPRVKEPAALPSPPSSLACRELSGKARRRRHRVKGGRGVQSEQCTNEVRGSL